MLSKRRTSPFAAGGSPTLRNQASAGRPGRRRGDAPRRLVPLPPEVFLAPPRPALNLSVARPPGLARPRPFQIGIELMARWYQGGIPQMLRDSLLTHCTQLAHKSGPDSLQAQRNRIPAAQWPLIRESVAPLQNDNSLSSPQSCASSGVSRVGGTGSCTGTSRAASPHTLRSDHQTTG